MDRRYHQQRARHADSHEEIGARIRKKYAWEAEESEGLCLKQAMPAVVELDPEGEGFLRLEEPGNAIHSQCIPAILFLLQDITVM